jgi:hypothetical protein
MPASAKAKILPDAATALKVLAINTIDTRIATSKIVFL